MPVAQNAPGVLVHDVVPWHLLAALLLHAAAVL